MKWSWKLGRFLGIDVHVHATFAALLAFVAARQWLAGGGVLGVADSILFTLAVFACILMHEYGHALAARTCGVGTRDITLLPIGGLARLDRMPSRPIEELWIALAGPAVNVVIACGLLAWLILSRTLEPLGAIGLTAGPFLERLLIANVGLVLFNMLPAFPMDGGRALRALLAIRLDHAHATRVAAGIGQAMALLFGLIGLLGNPMLLIVAFFIWIGAAQEAGAASTRSALDGVTVSQVMLTEFSVLDVDDRLALAVERVLGGSQSEFPVLRHDRIVGVLTSLDLMDALARGGPETRVGDALSAKALCVDAAEPVDRALERMGSARCDSVPVLSREKLVGLLTLENIREFLMLRSALGDQWGRLITGTDRAAAPPAGR